MDISCHSSSMDSSALITYAITFPETFLYYLKKNANPKLLLKLFYITKYFQSKKFPFIIVKHLTILNNIWELDTFENRDAKRVEDISKNLWITERLGIFGADFSVASKIVVCNVKNLHFYDYKTTTLDELRFLISNKTEEIRLYKTKIVRRDNREVRVEEVFPVVSKVRDFLYELPENHTLTFTKESTKNIIEHLHNSQITNLYLHKIPETFDIDAFSKFIMKNPRQYYCLLFRDDISVEYSQTLQINLNKLIEDAFIKKYAVLFRFPRQTPDSESKSRELCRKFVKNKGI